MKVTIERAHLLKSLGHAQSVVERRNTIPILSNVKLQAEDRELRLTATDMDLEIVESVAAEVTAAGATTVPAHTLYDIVRKLPDGSQVELQSEQGGERLTLRCGRSRFTLACLPIEDFPALTSSELPFRFRLPAAEMRLLIDRTRFAISTEETRYYLNGIYLHAAQEGRRRRAACGRDRRASAGARGNAGSGRRRRHAGRDHPAQDRGRSAQGHRRGGRGLELAISETQIRFSVGPALITSKLIDGTFPDYERVIPEHNDKQLDVVCRDFKDAVDRVSAISNDRSRAVKLKVANGTLELSASSPEHGSASEELEVRYDGDAMEIGFNSRYLLDIAEQIGGDNARLSMADAASPTILHELGDRSAIYVLMPMRV